MFYNENDPKSLEKYSCAVSLSDMEIYIFPELIYALTVANIISPQIWHWRNDKWFKDLQSMKEAQRVKRMKQFIMDKFVFNLDLDTWGLTTKEQERGRFDKFIDFETLAQSNALFGYEGDKYYFSMDIRRHFGLEKYDSDIIPYWKTETLEAMNAFKFKDDYSTGAGECVSLATLYAAAIFVLAEVPLEKIYLLATPLHSQNFIDLDEGLVTNNRRIVTKSMWFNGTELSDKAQRALRNEKVTLIINNEGYVHTQYKEATMPKESFEGITAKMADFLKTPLDFQTLCSFLRKHEECQHYFQFSHQRFGRKHYIEAEKAFRYELDLSSRVGTESHKALFNKIEIDDFYENPISGRADISEIEAIIRKYSNKPLSATIEAIEPLLTFEASCKTNFVANLTEFCEITPRFPKMDKEWTTSQPIELTNSMGRDDIIKYLLENRDKNPIIDLAFMAYRDMNLAPWKPFFKAAFERNPVTIEFFKDNSIEESYSIIQNFVDESIYDGARVAQPDEVVNFKRGDGLEKAIAFANLCNKRGVKPQCDFLSDEISIIADGNTYKFKSQKDVRRPVASDFECFLA